ncbi:MAG: hypothetical protein JXP73_18290 [Deltaproteobacteria bacterium]|nr:hypothetical protein [Deltaproteobacteria bacterium]
MLALLALLAALDAGPPPANVASPPPLRNARAVLADYAKAIGDEKAWKKHKSVRVKREVAVKAMNFKGAEETRLVRGGKIFSTSVMPGLGTFRRGYDGRTAWSEDPIFGRRVLKGAEADEVRIAATWNSEWRLAEVYSPVRSVAPPEGAPKGQRLECVELGKPHGKPSVACFDAKTHLRVWERGVQASQGGEVPYATRFSDWRLVDGVRVWHQEEVTAGPVTMSGRILEIVFDEPVPAKLFSLPKSK